MTAELQEQRLAVVREHMQSENTHATLGTSFRSRMVALFLFDDGDRIVCERVYFDTTSIRRQLLGDGHATVR